MSFDIWHDNGYGFETSQLQDGKMQDVLRNFILSHKDTVATLKNGKSILEDLETMPTDIYGILERNFDVCCYADIIAPIICKETGILVWSSGMDDDGREAVLFYPRYPWEMTEKVMLLTQEELDEIFLRYMKELQLEDEPEELSLIFSG